MKLRRAVVPAVLLAATGCVVLALVAWSSRVDAELHHPNPAVRAAAVRGLDVKANAGRWVVSLKDDDADVRLLSALRLGERRSGTPALVAGLIEALRDRHAGVRGAAAEALGGWWPGTEQALTAALTSSSPRVRAGAALALTQSLSICQPQTGNSSAA